MAWPFRRHDREERAASAQRVEASTNGYSKRLTAEWQTRAWAYLDTVGEIGYASHFYSRGLSRLELYVATQNPEDPDGEPVPVTRDMSPEAQRVIDAWDAVQDSSGGRANLQGAYGRIMFIAGEGYLLCTWRDTPDGTREVWEFVSSDELVPSGDGWERRKQGGASSSQAEKLRRLPDGEVGAPGYAVAYRLWRRHPRFSGEADSPMRAVLDICEELYILTMAIRSQARSRIARAGILIVADEAGLPAPAPAADGSVDADPFLEDLGAHMTAPLLNEGTAEDMTPMLVRVKSDYVGPKGFYHLTFGAEANYAEQKLREEAIGRLATGLDMPREILLGLQDSNHWTGWMIDRQSWQAHLEPIADMMVDDFTVAYLRPALEAAGVADLDAYVLRYDASRVISNPDRGKYAVEAYDRYGISWESLRKSLGFDDADAPDPAEQDRRAELQALARRGTSITEVPAEGGATGGDEGAPPDPEQAASATLGGVVNGAAMVALHQCRAKAGSRLRTRLNGDQALRDVPNHQLAAALGPDGVRGLHSTLTPDALVRGATDTLILSLEDAGVPPAAALHIAAQVEAHAAKTLYDPDPDPPRL